MGEPQRVLTVGRWTDEQLSGWFTSCEPAGSVRNAAGVDNDEDGVPLRPCTGPRGSWRELCPSMQRLG